MKILLLGSSGLLGSDCKEVLSKDNQVIAPSKDELDIISWDGVINELHNISPDVIINCAAFTDVDACETEPFAVRKTNVEGPRNLAQGSARFKCRLVHISSDYVFRGQKGIPQPYFEDDPTDPISAYGASKLDSEIAVSENSPNYIILRTGWLYGIHRNDFINSVLVNALKRKSKSIKVVDDQVGSPTWSYRVALQIKELLNTDVKGTFHTTSEGFCSRLECAQFIFDKLKVKTILESCCLSDFQNGAKRPRNCILENRLLKTLGLNIMKDWKEDLKDYLEKYGKELLKQAKSARK